MDNELRRPGSILSELDQLHELIDENRRLVEEDPAELALQLNLMSLESRETFLLDELRIANKRNAIDTFDLEIKGKYVENHRISSDVLGKTLIKFQSVIHSIDYSLKEGPSATQNAIPETIRSSSRIDTLAMCPASFRLVLSSNQPSWFGESPTKIALRRFNRLLDCGDNKDLIKQEIKELGLRTINRYKDFLDTVYNTSVEIKLYDAIKPEGFETKVLTYDLAKKIWDVIDLEEAIPEQEDSYRGTLKGLSLINYTFQFVIDETGDVIGGGFDSSLSDSLINMMNKTSVGLFKIAIKRNELSEKLYKVYTLLNLSE